MNISAFIAWRYIRSKKSRNAISVISTISTVGIALATMAIVCTLSVFNGFQDLITSLYSYVDPDIKIVSSTGKTFDATDSLICSLQKIPQVESISRVIEDNVMVEYKNRQTNAIVKGVEDIYPLMVKIDSVVWDGGFILHDPVVNYGNIGVGLAGELGVGANFVEPVSLYVPKRGKTINMLFPLSSLNKEDVFVSSVLSINQMEFDSRYIIVPISVTRSLFDYQEEVSALEIKAQSAKEVPLLQKEIKSLLGDQYKVLNQKEQQGDFIKVTQIEKWITFLILGFIVLIATFNVISSLSMLIVDKKSDIKTLFALGADSRQISNIFLMEGWMISIIGALLGVIIGVLLCLLQQYFGFLSLGDSANFIVNSYPVRVDIQDVAATFIMVSTIGFLAVLYPAKKIRAKG